MPKVQRHFAIASLALLAATACSGAEDTALELTDVDQSQQAVIITGLQVQLRDESPNDATQVRPRLFVRNNSNVSLSNFKVHYFFSVEAGKTPVAEDYYTPLSTISLENLGGTLYRAVYDFAGTTLAPGQTLPDVAGNVVGLRYSDWSAWTRNDDWSYTGVTSQFAVNDKVVIVDSSGGIVKGTPPTAALPFYEFLTQTLSVRTPKKTDPRHFVVLADGALKFWDGSHVKGRVANVGTTSTWLSPNVESGSVFSRPALTVKEGVDVFGDVFKGGSASIAASANVTGNVSSYTFDPKDVYTLSVLSGRESAGAVTVPAAQTRNLIPGRYGDLKFNAGSKVVLTKGTYWFDQVLAFPAGSTLSIDDSGGPVRVFVGKPFDVFGNIEHTASGSGANWLLGILGSGTVKVQGAFLGTLWAPAATVQVNKATNATLVGAVYGATVNVMNDAQVRFDEPEALQCLPKQVRVPRAATCASSNVTIASHTGITRAIWEGAETAESGKRVSPNESFTFTFSQAVTLADLSGAVSLVSTQCSTPQTCGHEVALSFEYANANRTAVTLSNPSDAFHPDCEYELRINKSVIGDGQTCLANEAVLRFRSLGSTTEGALGYETDRVRHAPKTRGLTALEFRPGISWQPDELIAKRGSNLSLRSGIDTLVPVGSAATLPDSKLQSYEQRYRGVPVLAHGYQVHQDLGTGRVRKLLGRTATGLTLSTTPTVTEAQARSTAQAAFPGGAPLPQGRLVIWSRSAAVDPSAFKLAWTFEGRASDNKSGRTLIVDAQTRALLVAQSTVLPACGPSAASIDLSTLTYAGPYTLELPNLQTDLYGTSDAFTVSEYRDAAGRSYFPLFRKASDIPDVPVSLFTQCINEVYPRVVQYRGPTITDPETATLSQAQLAADLFFETLSGFSQRNGDPWIGWDGTGALPLDIRAAEMRYAYELGAAFIKDGGSHVIVDTPKYFGGASVDIMGHEITHLIMGTLHGYQTQWEAKSINEGFASVIGSFAEYEQRREVLPDLAEEHLWCFGADFYDNQLPHCRERFDDPLAAGAPKAYQGQNWVPEPDCTACAQPCASGDTACIQRCMLCDAHENASVLEHWFYLLARGGQAEEYCGASVAPLDQDFDTAIELAVAVAWETVLRELPDNADYAAFVEASLSATRSLFPGDDAKEQTVASAWQAVGLHDGLADDASVYPERGATGANPWGNIVWKAFDEGTNIQVDTSYSFNGNNGAPLIDTVVAESESQDGLSHYTATLQPNTQYYWRVRPESEDGSPWQGCRSVNWFTTGDLPKVEIATPDGSEELDPGGHRLTFVAPEGPVEYEVTVSSSGASCDTVGDVFEDTLPAPAQRWDTISVGFNVSALEPYEHYWLNVMPVGPGPDAPHGSCSSFELPVGGLPEPTISSPADGSSYSYNLPHKSGDDELSLKWRAQGASSFDVTFYKRKSNGECETEPDHVAVVDAATHCTGVGLQLCTLSEEPFPLTNGTGYCWQVLSKSADGVFESEASELKKFGFFMGYVSPIEPGAPLGSVDTRAQTGAIVAPAGALDDDEELTFSWSPQAGIDLYGFRLARWPWPLQTNDRSAQPQPANCVGSSSCTAVPDDGFLVDEVVFGTEISIDAELAGEGRYCWDVWPVLSASWDPTEPNSRQPSAHTFTSCYTTGPSKPKVEVLQDSPGDGSKQPIIVEFQLDYVPDGQFSVLPSDEDATTIDYSGCSMVQDAVRFADYYDCRIKMGVNAPKEDESYDFKVRVSNDPVYTPESGADPEHEVYLVGLDQAIDVGSCGDLDEACCEGTGCDCEETGCDTDKVVCDNDTCQECGLQNQPCCDGNECEEHRECVSGMCELCGNVGDRCCAGDFCYDEDPEYQVQCDLDRDECRQCGFEGGPCCPDGTCNPGSCNGGECTGCGGIGETCCDGQCDGEAECTGAGYCYLPPQCDSPVVPGGDEDETHTLELGSTSGVVTFSLNTYNIPDQMFVYYEGQMLLDTNCIGTNGAIGPGWTCNATGVCSKNIPYSGSSSKMTVHVSSGCTGEPDTSWWFNLSCPL